MGLAINNNVASLTAQNNLGKTNSMLSSSLEKLSTGLKVNRGADGPAALVISEKQRAQISGLRTALDNTNKAVSLVQTGEGALNEINRLLNKARGLALDSANAGVNDANAFAANQAELSNILGTVDKIANSTEFNGKKLLDGSAGVRVDSASTGLSVSSSGGAVSGTYNLTNITAAVKANATETFTALTAGQTGTLTLNGVDIDLNETNAGTETDFINTINNFSGQTGVVAKAGATAGDVDLAAKEYGTAGTFQIAATGTTGGFTGATTVNAGVDLAADVDIDGGTAISVTGTGNSVSAFGLTFSVGDDPATAFTTLATDASAAITNNQLTFQIGSNAGQTALVGLDDSRSASLGQGVSGSNYASLALIDISSGANAQDSITVIDKAISDVSNRRAKLGAFQSNTLESTANNLRTSLENTVAAESIIRDTDFASEIANFTKYQTMMQAGSTVLGNANQMTQLVAGLLRG